LLVLFHAFTPIGVFILNDVCTLCEIEGDDTQIFQMYVISNKGQSIFESRFMLQSFQDSRRKSDDRIAESVHRQFVHHGNELYLRFN